MTLFVHGYASIIINNSLEIIIGFLFVILFDRGGSLYPCVITHAVINITSAFANEEGLTVERRMLFQLALIAIAAGYIFVLNKTLPQKTRTKGTVKADR